MSQWFGENPSMYAFLGLDGHSGIDIVRPWYEELYAVEDGIIADVKNSPDGFGQHLRLISDTGRGWTYGHNAVNLVEVGQRVKAGDLIARMGNTGFVVSSNNGNGYWVTGSNRYAGTHCHLGLRELEVSTKKKAGYWRYNTGTPWIKVKNYDNGFKGAIDPRPLLNAESTPSEVKEDNVTIVIRLIRALQKLGILKN